MTVTDRALLEGVAAGDQAALAQLYNAYRARLWRYLWLRLGGDAGLVEEALQDVFVSVWRTAGAFRGEASVATWLYRIAHHIAANTLRARSRRIEGQRFERLNAAPDEDSHTGDYEAPTLEDHVLARISLQEALLALSGKHREALDLLFVHGFTYDEIAGIVGVPVGTVKSRVSYARRALHASLAAEQPLKEIIP